MNPQQLLLKSLFFARQILLYMLKDHSVISPIITPLADMSMAGWGVSSREIATCQDRTRDRIEIGAFEEKKKQQQQRKGSRSRGTRDVPSSTCHFYVLSCQRFCWNHRREKAVASCETSVQLRTCGRILKFSCSGQ